MREWVVVSVSPEGKTSSSRVPAVSLALEDGALVFRDQDSVVVQAFASGEWVQTDRVDDGRKRGKADGKS